MKILIYGAGVIGSTYGWQLTKAGHDISLLVRENKKQAVEKNGIFIHYTDYRNGENTTGNTIFHPRIIGTLTPDNDFEYIIVTITNLHIKEVLPVLKEASGKAHILFFQNVWLPDPEQINQYLSPGQYFFGFPFMAGGGRGEKGIHAIISGSKYSKTMLGEVNGEITPRIQKIADAMAKAGMIPCISNRIITWLLPHCAFIVAISAGIIKAGGNLESLLADSVILRETIKAIREGFRICEAAGINPKKEKVNQLYYLPLFICLPIVRKVFSDPAMQAMFNGYITNSIDEINHLMSKIIESGKMYNYKTPYLNSLNSPA